MRLRVLQKNEVGTMEIEKKKNISPVVKYLSGTANLIEAGIAL